MVVTGSCPGQDKQELFLIFCGALNSNGLAEYADWSISSGTVQDDATVGGGVDGNLEEKEKNKSSWRVRK